MHASTAALNASAKAHRKWNVDTTRWVDVFDVAADNGIGLIFRPLAKLGAAILSEPGAAQGIIVNSNHPLSRQRYSVAHELGHLFFKHPTTMDFDDVFQPGRPPGRTDHEKLAETFASWFLMPPDMLNAYAAKRGIPRFESADQVYQLSLFLGTSYEATVNHLRYSKRASSQRALTWLTEKPAKMKRRAGGVFAPLSLRNDVHVLLELDSGGSRLTRSGDRIVIELHEIPSSGYRWKLRAKPEPITVLFEGYGKEDVSDGNPAKTGRLRKRKIVLEVGDVDERMNTSFAFDQVRSWQQGDLSRTFTFNVTIETKERLGVPRRYFEGIAA
jgi:hypothetical protein